MNYGLVLPFGDARQAADLAREAEEAGWDAFFVWEAVWGPDAWVALTAAAMQTERIRLGTMLTPLPWLNPVRLAATTATLDHLSNGRVILAVGLGATDTGPESWGLPSDRRLRAELLDEGLAILEGLWRGQPFTFDGKHYRIRPSEFAAPPKPVNGRITTWCVGAWPRPKSMRRVLRCDGILPNPMAADGTHRNITLEDIRDIGAWLKANSPGERDYDIVVEGETDPADEAAMRALIEPQRDAGASWWIETRWMVPRDESGMAAFRERLRAGPPRL